jgi:hypothetical protein
MDSEQKVRIFVAADCLCIFQVFKSTFLPYFLKHNLVQMFYENNFLKKFIFNFLVKNRLCIFVNIQICFLFSKIRRGPHFFYLYP